MFYDFIVGNGGWNLLIISCCISLFVVIFAMKGWIPPMKKSFLSCYKAPEFFALNSHEVTYTLSLETIWFGGLFKTKDDVKFNVPENEIKNHRDYWDNLIIKKLPIKL